MLELRNISQKYDDLPVLTDIDLSIEEGEIVCLLGESGSGKTTLLRIVAGLETLYDGEVHLYGEALRDVSVHERGFGLVFQDFALFPHLSVARNVAFGLEMQGMPKRERSKRVQEMLALVRLADFAERDVTQLSGGEKQRVALARSLAPHPRLLMLDEPLGSLDASLRAELVMELRTIIKEMGVTALYVTHDQQEAYAVADRVAVMNAGRIEQVDTPQAIYRHPKTEFVARFLGLGNIFPTTLLRPFLASVPADERVLLHPVGLRRDNGGRLRGTLERRHFQGSRYEMYVRISPEVLLHYWEPFTANGPDTGDAIALGISPEWIISLD